MELSHKVYIHFNKNVNYPLLPPFGPGSMFPEYPFSETSLSREENGVYSAVRICLNNMGLDQKSFGTSHWNPFGCFIKPGNRVLIKPNMVNHYHSLGHTMDCLITHGSVIRAICDYVIIALKGHGRITIGDAPIQEADFSEITAINGTKALINFYSDNVKNIDLEVVDFRRTIAVTNKMGHIIKIRKQKNIDFQTIEMGKLSMFKNVESRKFVAPNYPENIMQIYHKNSSHRYVVPDCLLQADVIINLPKPKTHRFAGITGAMKNFIGVTSIKENLPHYSRGSVNGNGDEYPASHILKKIVGDISNVIAKMAYSNKYIASLPLYILRKILLMPIDQKKEIFKGMWYGNDTIWRTTVDINRIVYYADKTGAITNTPQRIIFTIMDGIVAGEGQGPLEPTPKHTGVLMAGFNPFAIDLVLSSVMKFNYRLIPLLSQCPKELGKIDSNQLIINSNIETWHRKSIEDIIIKNGFKPALGWEILLNKGL